MPNYNRSKNLLVEAALTGQGISKFLYEFEREDNYEERQKQSFYSNNVQPIIDSLVSPLFGQTIVREGQSKEYEEFLLDVDGKGSTMEEFMLNILKSYKAHSNAFIVIDQKDSLRELPYITLKKQTELYAYEYKENGVTLDEITFINGYTKAGKKLLVKYTDEKIYEFVEGSPEGIGVDNELGIIPVISLNPNIEVYPAGYDLGKIAITIYNQDSEQRENERLSAFAVLYAVNDNPDENVLLKSDSIIWVPSDATVTPGYVSPDANVLKTLRESSESLTTRLWTLAQKMGVQVNESAVAKSGLALGMEFIATSVVLKNLSRFSGTVEQSVSELFMAFGYQEFNMEVNYPTEFAFSIDNVNRQLETIKSAAEVGIKLSAEELQIVHDNLIKSL